MKGGSGTSMGQPMGGDDESKVRPLVTVTARAVGPKCPFASNTEVISFALLPGGCVWLQGSSGRGKTTLAMSMAGLLSRKTMKDRLVVDIQCDWDPTIVASERCGVLFQQTALLDELTVAGNLAVALHAVGDDDANTNTGGRHHHHQSRDRRIKQLLEAVGLDYDRDAGKRPTELSGGMARRAGSALQLGQRKHVIVWDEPFTGLDYDAVRSVAKELVHVCGAPRTRLWC